MSMMAITWWLAPAALTVIVGAVLMAYGARVRKKKVRQEPGNMGKGLSVKDQPFDELLAAMIKQTEQTFQTVVEALHTEQQMLQEYAVRRTGSSAEKGTVTRLADVSPKRKREVQGKRRKKADVERVVSSGRCGAADAAQLGRRRRTEDDSFMNASPTQGELNLIADLQRIQQE